MKYYFSTADYLDGLTKYLRYSIIPKGSKTTHSLIGGAAMSEFPGTPAADELKKLSGIATDMHIDGKMRVQAIGIIGQMASHEALLVLLELVANDKMDVSERELALKKARDIVKKGL
jgi:hypothetical protein